MSKQLSIAAAIAVFSMGLVALSASAINPADRSAGKTTAVIGLAANT